ncbi:unnamed protein product [Paramecium sonneborni]|uniref:Uncharacterized protein n=1 Tax=Paramecium sonneborni TaxID=65129 RepID=A0A8S1M4W1_9CILI|nr:unnamed protein product [Paramecium sonneborni]
MQSCKHQTIIQSIYSDYVFDSWTKNYETSRNQDPKTTKLKVSSQRKQSLKIRAIMNSNNEYSTSQSQAQKKNQNIFRQLILSNLEELNDEQQNSYSKQSERSKNKSSNRFYSQHKKRQKEDFEQLTESITNNSTIFSQPLKNSKPSMLSFSQNRKLILPKINQLQSQKLLITKFKVISKVIGKFILLFYQILPNTNPLKLLYKNKLKMMMNLKKTFKFERNIDEGLSKSFTQWVEPAFQKIFYHLQNSLPKIYQENVKESKEQKDQEEIWMLNFAKFLFQNLELITRRGNVPKEIISAMSKTIYRKNNKYLQLFIAQRTQFNQYNLNFLEIQLIISEYILFNAILIPMFNLANNLKYQSFNHNINCKIKILELAKLYKYANKSV